VHALLGLTDKEALPGHPVAGPNWEGMAIENLLVAAETGGHQVQPSFYRTSHGAKIHLVLDWPDGEQWAIEIKRSLAPTPERGSVKAAQSWCGRGLGDAHEPDRRLAVFDVPELEGGELGI
jgi:uncharacterized protein